MLLLVMAGIVMLYDAWLSASIAQIAPHATIQRRMIKQSYRFFEWYSYVVLIIVLLTQPQKGRLLAGFGMAVGLGASIIHALKFSLGRARPQVELGAYHFAPFSIIDDFDAFPSGHVGGAVMLSLLAGIYFPRLLWPLLSLACLVAVGRIVQERHFLSDTLAGAGIAILAVGFCYRRLGSCYYPPLFSRRTSSLESSDEAGSPPTADELADPPR